MGDQEETSTDGIDPEALGYARELQSVAKEITHNEEQTIKLKSIVETIAHESVKEERDYLLLTGQTRDFVKSLGFTAPFSVSRTKAIINILLLMWNHTNVARYVMKSVYNVDIATTVDEMLEQFPSDLKQLDERSAEIFAKALKDGSEQVKNIRLMVVGMFGVGKTSLTNNLIKDLRDENIIPNSTEGIDMRRCQLMNNGDWHLDKEQKAAKYHSRFKNAIVDVMKPSNNDVHYDLPNIQLVPYEEEHEASETVSEQPPDPLAAIAQKVQGRKNDVGIRDILQIVQEEPVTKPDDPVNIPVPVETKTDITVSVWDFAGQTLYYSTHQFFLNRRSIYLVLMDMTKDLNEHVKEGERSGTWCGLVKDCTYLDVFKFWLNAIHMYSGYRSMTGKIHPTVILVGTRKDEMMGTDEEKEEQNDKYFDRALRSFKGSPILDHIHKVKFLVNNLSPADTVFDQIRREILSLAEKQDYWGERYPIRWIQMEQSLDKLRDTGKQVLHIKAIDDANQLNIQAIDKKELELFLEIQHRHGNILYFHTEQLKHTVVLAPQWIIEVFKRFITHIRGKDPKLTEHWTLYEESAILRPEVFKEIMDNSQEDIKDNREIVLNYMEYLDVMAKPVILEETDEANEQVDQPETVAVAQLNFKLLDFHIVPCRLKNPPPPISRFTSPENCEKTPVLCFVFVENFMPPSFFHRLVAVCIRTWPISKLATKDQLYNGLAVFDINKTEFLTIWYKDHIIYARVSSCRKDRITDLNVGLCQDVRLTLLKSLRNFVSQSLENPRTPIAFEEYIQCPEMEESVHNEGMFRCAEFTYNREIKCTACRSAHTVERKDAMNYWYNTTLDSLDNDDDLNTTVSESDLSKLAKDIGNEYWMLGIELGLTNQQMNQLSANYDLRKDRCTFVFQYMVNWLRKEGERATQQRLVRAIRAARLCVSKDGKITPVIF